MRTPIASKGVIVCGFAGSVLTQLPLRGRIDGGIGPRGVEEEDLDDPVGVEQDLALICGDLPLGQPLNDVDQCLGHPILEDLAEVPHYVLFAELEHRLLGDG